jgi:hypothetical protein
MKIHRNGSKVISGTHTHTHTQRERERQAGDLINLLSFLENRLK